MFVADPTPLFVAPPGVLVINQFPGVVGKPPNLMVPVASAQVGCVIEINVGAVGVTG